MARLSGPTWDGVALLLIASLGGALAAACFPSGQSRCPEPAISGAVRIQVAQRDNNTLIADTTVALDTPAPVYLEYGNAELGWLRTPTRQAAAVHRLPLMRLREDTAYEVRAFTIDEAGCPSAAGAAQFRSGKLPSEFKKFDVRVSGQTSYPLTLMDLRVSFGDYAWLLALDRDGRVVWYYEIPPLILRSAKTRRAYGLVQRDNGNLAYLASLWGVEEITPDGKVVRRVQAAEAGIHHDMTLLPDGRLLFIGAEERSVDMTRTGGQADQRVMAGALYMLDPATRQVERVWSVFEALDPSEPTPNLEGYLATTDSYWEGALDWNHMNSVALGARGNVLVSLRHQNQILSLSPDLRTVEWRLGGPSSSFSFPEPSDQFYGQHAVTETPEGHILMFDNGNFRLEGEYSRGLELELDFGTMTARKVWDYRHSPDIYTDRIGSAAVAPNGNRLVSFGFRSDDESPTAPVILVEATPNGTASWTHELSFRGARVARYRAYPITSLAGEQAVQPTPVRR